MTFIVVAGLVATVVDIGLAFALIPSLDAVGAAIANGVAILVAGVPCLALAVHLHRPVDAPGRRRCCARVARVAGGRAARSWAALPGSAPSPRSSPGALAFFAAALLLRPLAAEDAEWLSGGARRRRGRAARRALRAQNWRHVIDLHSHLLPGLDDGPADEAGSVALAAEVAAAGVRDDGGDAAPARGLPGRAGARARAARRRRCRRGWTRRAVALEVVSGGEVDVLWAQSASDEELRAASYGGRGTDLLVETPYGELPPMFEDLLFKIRVRGFRILLAHPERNPSFQRDPARLVRLVEGDVLVQLTAASVVGGGRAGKLCAAADRRRPRARDRGRPAPRRAGAARRSRDAVAAVDGERGAWMVTEAPAAILAGRPLPPAPAGDAAARGPGYDGAETLQRRVTVRWLPAVSRARTARRAASPRAAR